jgi:hypothetical protein
MRQKTWESKIPQTPKNRDRKRCYRIWTKVGFSKMFRAGGKVVWLTDKQLTFYTIKYPNKIFEEELDKDTKEYYKQYLHQTVD